MSKPEPKNYDMTFCTSDMCDSVKECARHLSNYTMKQKFYCDDLTNLIQECEHFEPLEETK
jgi:hypothetical protein